jgi:hypothetical protein
MRKLLRDPTELVSRAVQPVLWLTVFGQVMGSVRGIHAGPVSYLAFITPGILAQSVLFSAIFYGIAVIWERDLGVVHKQLVSPAYRSALRDPLLGTLYPHLGMCHFMAARYAEATASARLAVQLSPNGSPIRKR